MKGKSRLPKNDLTLPFTAVRMMTCQEIAMKMRVSLQVLAIMPAEVNGLMDVFKHRSVSAICAPAMENGTLSDPPRVASQRIPNTATMSCCPSKTARARKKKSKDVEGAAMAQHHPTAIVRAWHEPTDDTTPRRVSMAWRAKGEHGLTIKNGARGSEGQGCDPICTIRRSCTATTTPYLEMK
jgi:hypothetical protein